MIDSSAADAKALTPTNAELLERFAHDLDRARVDGVPPPLVGRARSHLLQTRSVSRARRLLTVFTELNSGQPIERYTFDFPALLDSDEERRAALVLVKRSLAAATLPADIENLTVQKFRLAGASPFDADVVRFVRDGMDRALVARRGGFQSRAKHFNYHDARDALVEAKAIFDRHGKRFFLDRGTLLGAVREGGFIASDYDIDVGVFGDEITLEEIKEMFADSSFTLTQDFEYKVGVVSAGGITVDFFLTTRGRGHFLSKGFRSVHNWYFSPFELIEHQFLGETFLIPDTYEKHLDENYGNWRNPAIFYDLSYNEPCVVYGRSAATLNYLSRRFVHALRHNWKYYSQAPTIGLRDAFGHDYTDWFAPGDPTRIAPERPSRREVRPIFVVDSFTEYTHRQRRLIESALSITPDVELIVIEERDDDISTGVAVASGIDRITGVHSVSGATAAELTTFLIRSPRSIVVTAAVAAQLSAGFVHDLRLTGCHLVVFDNDSVALTLDENSQVTVRNPG